MALHKNEIVPDPEPEYLNRIRKMPCAICGSPLQTQAHHHTHGATVPWESSREGLQRARGKGQKAHDSWAMPLCFRHHRQFHDAAGHFAGWTNEQRRRWQDELVTDYRGAFLDPDVF